MRISSRAIVLILGVIALSLPAPAQSGETPVYRKQFAELVLGMDEAYTAAHQPLRSDEDRIQLQERIFAI